uniref:Thyroglobulin type-1 domain-containing protein n=1 Tax=Trichuris muris TaxID=70415 RepID=A0A5S6QVI3_TRIMR
MSFVWPCLLLLVSLSGNTKAQIESMQCQRRGETCWCVDHLTGVEVEGSRVLLKQGVPLCGRFETELYYLNSTNVFCTRSDEAKVNKCLGNLYGTFLDLPYAQSNFNHLLFANYVFLSGKLDLACRLFNDYNECSAEAFNGTACRHCQHIVFMKLFSHLCRPTHLITAKQQVSCLKGLFMDESFIQCQLRLLDELKAVQQHGRDPQRLCAIKLQLQVCLLQRLPLHCEQDMIKILSVLPERIVEGLNVSCDGFLSLGTRAPVTKLPGEVTSSFGLTAAEAFKPTEDVSYVAYAVTSSVPTRMEEGVVTSAEGIVTAKNVSLLPAGVEFTTHKAEQISSEAGKIEESSGQSMPEYSITTLKTYPTLSTESGATEAVHPFEAATATTQIAILNATEQEITGSESYADHLGGITTAESTVGTPGKQTAEVFSTQQSLQTMETAEMEHSTRLPVTAVEHSTSQEWERSPVTELPEGMKTSAEGVSLGPSSAATTQGFPTPGTSVEQSSPSEPSGDVAYPGVSGASNVTALHTFATIYEGTKEIPSSTMPPTSSVLTEVTVGPEAGETTEPVTSPVEVLRPGEKIVTTKPPETAFVEDRRTSIIQVSHPAERVPEATEEFVISTLDSGVHVRPPPAGVNGSRLIPPLDIDCSSYNLRFQFCFRTHFFPASLSHTSIDSFLNNTWHWPKLAEVCRLFHDYLNCMHQPSLNPVGLCDPFGHTALVGMLTAVCEHDISTTQFLNNQCVSTTLRNVTIADQCVTTLIDFVRIIHYLPVSEGQICQRIRDMRTCASMLDVSECDDDLRFALAKLKLTGLQAETYLCGKYLLGPSLRQQVEWWNRRRSNDLPFEELGCLEVRRRALKSQLAKARYIPQCNPRGHYSLVQCDYAVGQCWCVDVETGIEQSKSRQPLSENIVCGACLVEKARLFNGTESKQSVPACQNNGLYAPLQCNFGTSECWCVDKRSGAEIAYTRVHKNRKLPRCNVKSEFSCFWIRPKKRCAPDGSAPKLILRWFREGWKCTLRPVSFCAQESHLPPFTFRFQSDCEEMCLGPYASKLPIKHIA